MTEKIIKIFDRTIGVRLSWFILIFLILLCTFLGYEYFKGKLEEHITALYGGLLASMIAVIIQLIMQWNEHREIEKFKKMGILKILPNRDGKTDYYYKILANSTKKIDFLGSTSYSFLRDFGSENSQAGEKASALIRALDRGVIVRVLVSKKDDLEQNKHSKFDQASLLLEKLHNRNPDKFNYRYLNEKPSHTLVTSDVDLCQKLTHLMR
jgi:hypothetical protein